MKSYLNIAIVLLFVLAACSTPQGDHHEATTANKPATASEKAAPQKTAPASNSSRYQCSKNGSDLRTVEQISKGKGCELNYTKGGKPSVVASSTNSTAHCDEVFARIRKKLTAAGYQCE